MWYITIVLWWSGVIELLNICKDYRVGKGFFRALDDVSLRFPQTGFVAILGSSGCGKTTLLNIIGGLDRPTSGELLFDGRSTKTFKDGDWDAYRNKEIGFVFQNYNLISHQSVLRNVETALLLNGASPARRKAAAIKALKEVGLSGLENKKPNQLSGGQMQRVAIARAIANDPSVVLADEPTGALDSQTSTQVMQVLSDISRERLVIMVTHNTALAEKYASLIIKMSDGKIESAQELQKQENTIKKPVLFKKTAMSFVTAARSSISNIFTKKARTIITAIASSIGIIGVALVLALSNGFSNYVSNVETSIASDVPITISRNSYASLTTSLNGNADLEEYPDDDTLHVYNTTSSTYITHTNYYDEEYVNGVLDPLVDDGLASSILINRQNLLFNVIKKVHDNQTGEDSYLYVEQYTSAGATASAVSSVTSLPATVFHELYGDEKSIRAMYDLIYGSYPSEPNEIVLITDRYNRVELSTLRNLGIIGEKDTQTTSISFADILANQTYKAYLPSKFYGSNITACDSSVTRYVDIKPSYDQSTKTISFEGTEEEYVHHAVSRPSATSEGYAKIYENDATYQPISLKIVGVLRPSKDSYIQLMPASLGYLSSLKDIFVDDTTNNCDFLHDAIDTAWYFRKTSNETTDGLSLLSTSVNALLEGLFDSENNNITTSQITSIANSLSYLWYNVQERYQGVSGYSSATSVSNYFSGAHWIGHDFKEDAVGKLIDALESNDEKTSSLAKAALLERILQPSFYANEHGITTNNYGDVFDMDFNIIDLIAYFRSYSLITSILIFPSALTAKTEIKTRLDAYNSSVDSSKQILYTDIVSTVTDTVSLVISSISIVLTIFASISLIVSSIMMSIITYVSVIERRKEIGILRACGARKRDIRRLFEVECALVGLVAGLLGILISYLISIPLNQIIYLLYSAYNLRNVVALNPLHALLLVAVSVVLAVIAGFIPAMLGAKKDPVDALRSE